MYFHTKCSSWTNVYPVLNIDMVGDVNLFYNDHDDPHSAEIEIMIAEPTYRRKGMGLEALRMMITYGKKEQS